MKNYIYFYSNEVSVIIVTITQWFNNIKSLDNKTIQ